MLKGAGDDMIWMIVGVTLMFLLLTSFAISFLFIYKRRKKIHISEKQALQSQYQQELLQTQLEIQEQTLKNISQEIHDNIGQALTLAKLNINTLPGVTTEQQEKISTTKELVSKAIVDLRDLSRSFNTDYIADMGLQKAIGYELTLIGKSSGIKTDIQVTGEPFIIERQKELILFRIVQEVLNNIVKHAEAKMIQASITYHEHQLELQLIDDGKGFDMASKQNENDSGLGLRNMNNRAQLIGATFSVNSGQGKGTEVRIILPKNT